MVWILPTTLEVDGVDYDINSDFRPCLTAMQIVDDPLIPYQDGRNAALELIFGEENLAGIKDYNQAFAQVAWFLNCGSDIVKKEGTGSFAAASVDWEQDGQLIFSGIAITIGHDIRMDEYCHFWSFMAYFINMDECTFTTVRSIRSKLSRHVKLESWEQEFYKKNRDIVDIKKDLQARENLFNQMFGI